MAITALLGLTLLEQFQTGAEIPINEVTSRMEFFATRALVVDRLTAEPGSPNDGEAWIITGTPTGTAWSAFAEHDIAYYLQGWFKFSPFEGFRAYIIDENVEYVYTGSTWTEGFVGNVLVKNGDLVVSGNHFFRNSVTDGITASVTQTQGQQALITGVNNVDTVANTNDTVTLPGGQPGRMVDVYNNGANTLQIFPASGDDIDGGSTDAAVTLVAGGSRKFVAMDSTSYISESVAVSAAAPLSIAAKTANYTATSSDDVITVDGTGGAFTITLPAAASVSGRVLHIKKIVTGGSTVTVDADGSELIDGATTQSLAAGLPNLFIVSDGTGWLIL